MPNPSTPPGGEARGPDARCPGGLPPRGLGVGPSYKKVSCEQARRRERAGGQDGCGPHTTFVNLSMNKLNRLLQSARLPADCLNSHGTRSRAEGDSRSAANRERRHASRFRRHRTRSNPGGCFGVVGRMALA
jgi:hypothetical protein